MTGDSRDYLTATEVAKRLGLSSEAVREHARQGRAGRRIMGRWAFTEEDVRVLEARPGRGRPPGWWREEDRRGSSQVEPYAGTIHQAAQLGRLPESVAVSNDELRTLAERARRAGNYTLFKLAERALAGDGRAILECALALEEERP